MTRRIYVAAAAITLFVNAAHAEETFSFGGAKFALSERRIGGDIIIAKDVRGIFAIGGRIVVQDSKTEAMIAAAGDISTQNATIDLGLLAAGTITMTGGSVKELKAAAGTLDLNTRVSGDIAVAGGNVKLGSSMTIGGTTDVSAGIADLAGTYSGNVAVEADSVQFSGTTNGDLRLSARQVTLLPGAVIGGDLIAPTLTVIPDGVTVKGEKAIGTKTVKVGSGDGINVTVDLDDKKPKKESDDSGLISPEPMGMGSWFTVLVTLAICGALALGVAPQFVARAAERLAKEPLPSLGVGLVSLLAVPMALILVGITIIGIPLAVLGAAAYAIGIGLGLICLCLWAGLMVRTLANQPGQETRVAKLVGWTLMGFLALALIGAIPLIGRWIQVLAVVTGAGAVISTAWAARRKSQTASAQPT
jgi:cytoskeletal protein CcmA (bactofilin family)